MIIQGKLPVTENPVNVTIEGGIISRIEPFRKGTLHHFGGPDLYICPGFFDPQVNGFAGVDFNGKGLTPEGIQRAAQCLALSGVTRFLPTLITAPHEKIERQLKIFTSALECNSLLRRMIPGIHLEGPYISPEDGPRGAHPREAVRPPDWNEFERFQEVCNGKIKCLTLAPEMEGAIPFIEKAVANGIVVGLGHTNASETVFEDALSAGARLSIHLGNGTPAFMPRHQNPIQKQLSMDGLMASIIVDGIHLPDYVVKNFVRAKGIERILLTTDSMAGAGAPPGKYTLGDLEVEVGFDRAVRLAGTPYLAGSTLSMERAINNIIRFAGVDLMDGLEMARKNGEKVFPEIGGEIISGSPADIVLFEYKDEMRVKATWVNGEKI
ncbi:MAG: amidohydrolase family protein [Deltaproteobacteria bacterium]|nr:amidohydrolase family protein [Deltaproteobacteria bacterium]